jgi:signal peptidase I
MMLNTNTLLMFLVALTVIVWLLQELIGRRQQQWAVAEHLRFGKADADLSGEPAWSDWTFKIILAAWIFWLVRVVMEKDGDFALVLVMLTLLSGVIGGLDRFWFERRRRAQSANLQGPHASSASESLVAQRPIAEYSRSFFPVLAAVLVLRSFIAEPFQIPSASMVPTLQVGDYILVDKFSYGLRLPVLKTKILDIGEPKRGDVIVFFPPHKNVYFIKRLIGLPGDHIQYRHKVLYINGEKAEQTYLGTLREESLVKEWSSEKLGTVEHSIHKIVDSFNPTADEVDVVVQPGHYFMMGDNRDNSADSRFWGQVPEENIVGRAFAIWMHWESIFSVPSFDRVGAIR